MSDASYVRVDRLPPATRSSTRGPIGSRFAAQTGDAMEARTDVWRVVVWMRADARHANFGATWQGISAALPSTVRHPGPGRPRVLNGRPGPPTADRAGPRVDVPVRVCVRHVCARVIDDDAR